MHRAGTAVILGLSVNFAAATAGAQARHVVTPRGFENRQGSMWAAAPGGFTAAHYQFFDGTLVGAGSKSMQQVAYRLFYDDTRNTTYGVGKSWREVELSVGEAGARTATFAANWAAPPTRVFRSAISWPTYKGRPRSKPASWDMAFPFQTRWSYSGSRPILLDYEFRGGTMANGATWVGRKVHVSQRLDSAKLVGVKIPANGKKAYYGNFTTTGCRDRQFPHPRYAWSDLSLRVYAKDTGHPGTSNRFEGRLESFYTAKNSLVIQALSSFGDPRGVPFFATSCNKLHLDLSKPAFYFLRSTTNDPNGYAKSDLGAVPFRPEYAGVAIWAQAAWDNSATGRIGLTRACKTVVPVQPPSQYSRYCLYYWDTAKPSGTGPHPDDYLNPIIRYTYE